MAPRLAPAIVRCIKDELTEPGLVVNHRLFMIIADTYRTTYNTVRCYWKRIREGRPQLTPLGGPRRVITREIEVVVYHLLNEMLWFYQDEISEFLHEVYGILVV
jgi:hypothetical protein